MEPVLQSRLPYDPFAAPPLPGMAPLDPAGWLIFDEAFAGQMAVRDRLLAKARDEVVALDPAARPAAQELLTLVLAGACPGADDTVRRRDGAMVPVDRGDPLGTVGRLVQQDFCLLEKRGAEHVMTAAVLCFPASWRLSEKFLHPLGRIHHPVESYDANVARRVQRLFDGIRPGRPLWRFNALWYDDASLHQPRSEAARHPRANPATAPYLRSERQSLLRLPQSGAVAFGIHTYVLARADALTTRGTA